jgi:hypothetical protein
MGGAIIGKLADATIRNWTKTGELFEGRADGEGLPCATVSGKACCTGFWQESRAPCALQGMEFAIWRKNLARQLMLHCA